MGKKENEVGIKRLEFLAERFNVFNSEYLNELKVSLQGAKQKGSYYVLGDKTYLLLNDTTRNIIGVVESEFSQDDKTRRSNVAIRVSDTVFGRVMGSDPTPKYIYVQWVLDTYSNLLKDGSLEKARQFVEEDLGMVKDYLTIFHTNKKRKLFKISCERNPILPSDPTNINQYTSLSQLFDAVDPFIVRDKSTLEADMDKYTAAGEGSIIYKDRKYTIWQPLTPNANSIMEKYASWCTAHRGGSYFNTYTTGNKTPDGKNSKIYCIINNDVYSGKSNEVYQIHFESKQIKCRRNSSNVDIYDLVFRDNPGVSQFFKKELEDNAKLLNGDINNNMYIDYLIEFGYAESYFDYIDINSTEICVNKKKIPVLPNLSKFKKVQQLLLSDLSLEVIKDGVGNLSELEVLSLSDNKLTKLPEGIGNLKNLDFLNIRGNSITEIPDDISGLDSSNGGRCFRISIGKDELSKENYSKLKRLLPNVRIGS